jgi:hypothetical protein
MTRMSDPRSIFYPDLTGNYLQSQDGSRLARRVHVTRSIVGTALSLMSLMSLMLLLTLVGCVIPPSLRIADEAVNSPPAILSITSDQLELAEPKPVFVERGETAGNLSVSLIDTDLGDTLFVRIFVDYNLPDRLPARVTCVAAPNEDAFRTVTCNMAGLCAMADIGVQRNMTIVVFDRRPDDTGADPQHMDADDGRSTGRFYFLSCQLPQTT